MEGAKSVVYSISEVYYYYVRIALAVLALLRSHSSYSYAHLIALLDLGRKEISLVIGSHYGDTDTRYRVVW